LKKLWWGVVFCLCVYLGLVSTLVGTSGVTGFVDGTGYRTKFLRLFVLKSGT